MTKKKDNNVTPIKPAAPMPAAPAVAPNDDPVALKALVGKYEEALKMANERIQKQAKIIEALMK